jgi:hypothetical protein
MKKTFNTVIMLLCAGFTPLLCGNCASLVEKSGRLLDGSASAEKITAIYTTANVPGNEAVEIQIIRNKAGEYSFLLLLKKHPAIKLRGSMPDEKNEFYLTSLDYLGGNRHGWNEYRLDLFGTGNLTLGETSAVISFHPEIQPVQISSGRIRRYDTLITGGDALTNLRNRRERITAVVEWMASLNNPQEQSLDEFDKYRKPLLFPEMTAKKQRHKDWRQEGDILVRAEGILWNTSYTERVFPEELWNVRNSGTMLRDWEEALEWIYFEYEWEKIKELLSHQIILQNKPGKRLKK